MAETLTFQSTLFSDAASAMRCGIYRVARVPFDDSETEDIVLVRKAAMRAAMRPAASNRTETGCEGDSGPEAAIAPSNASLEPVNTHSVSKRPPKRIGNGKLVSMRVQWRPGDPFGQAARAPARGFEWNRMFRSACVTAVSGLILVWLLHIA
ncbi:MAG: hypothetical protein H6819_00225 [Phycisphaerales bacterium]|nr:hypothetical protein [Phycisphaerales bacterium]MCB9857366.1 hypothetical protein [Phycisphaerales bacterium]